MGALLVDGRHGRFWLEDCDALRDDEPCAWISVLDDEKAAGLDAVVAAVNPRASAHSIDPGQVSGRKKRPARAWEIVIEEGARPRDESRWARAARLSTSAGFEFRSRR